jgi:hypothetical protein
VPSTVKKLMAITSLPVIECVRRNSMPFI